MNPCAKNKQLIASFALNALDERQAPALREHLAGCPGCRRYFEEISRVSGTLSATGIPPLETLSHFHQEVMAKVRATKQNSLWQITLTQFRALLLNWRVAVPACALALAVVLISFNERRHPEVPPVARNAAPVTPSPEINVDLPPTIGNYMKVAAQSADQLDDLLVRQGIQDLSSSAPPSPTYSVSYLHQRMF